MSSSAETATELQILGVGRKPVWTEQQDSSGDYDVGIPTTLGAGVSMDGGQAVAALLKGSLREQVHTRRARVSVGSFDASATYSVIVDGSTISTTSGAFADDDEILVELAGAIDADSAVGGAAPSPVIEQSLLDADGEITLGTAAGGTAAAVLRISGTSSAAYPIDVSATAGSLACDADAESATTYLMIQARSTGTDNTAGGSAWANATDYQEAITYLGSLRRLNMAGVLKAQVYLDNVQGHSSDGSSVTLSGGLSVSWGIASLE